MATKTVVCPECGTAAALGRYACADCGSLLAAVAMPPRSVTPPRTITTIGPAEEAEAPPERPAQPGPAREVVSGRGAGDADADPVRANPAGEPNGDPIADPIADPNADPNGAASGGSLAFDEDAPLAMATPAVTDARAHEAWQPDVLDALPHGALAEDSLPDPIDVTATAPSLHDPVASDTGGADPAARAPFWPPPGVGTPVSRPDARTPAGSYLPPSAVLPPLDGPFPSGWPAASTAASGAAGTAGTAALHPASGGGPALDWLGRASASIGQTFGSARVTTYASRRAVAAGSGLAAVSLLLPWVNSLPGSSPFTGYLDRWGLAGPGLWLVLVGLVGLAAVAMSSGRARSWPVGTAALVTAAFLIGLVWPYAIGGYGRAIGIWTVTVAVVVLVVGGILERRGRHEAPDTSVQGSDR